jgi:hypothetical protein
LKRKGDENTGNAVSGTTLTITRGRGRMGISKIFSALKFSMYCPPVLLVKVVGK